MSQKNLVVYGKNGKRLGGGAAQLKRIKDNGGWDEHHRQVIADAVEIAYQTFEKNQNRVKLKRVKKIFFIHQEFSFQGVSQKHQLGDWSTPSICSL